MPLFLTGQSQMFSGLNSREIICLSLDYFMSKSSLAEERKNKVLGLL